MKHIFLLTLLCVAEGGSSKTRKESPGPSSPSNEAPPNLGSVLVETEDPPECSICAHCLFEAPGTPCQTPCTHVFHRRCITRWLSYHQNCPLCRGPLQRNELQDFESMSYTTPPENVPRWAAIAVGESATSAARNPRIFRFGTQVSKMLEYHYQEYLKDPARRTFDLKGMRYAFDFEFMTQENRGNRALVRALLRKEPASGTEFTPEDILNALNNYHDNVKSDRKVRTPIWEGQEVGHYPNVNRRKIVTFTNDNNGIIEDAYQHYRDGGEANFQYQATSSDGTEISYNANFETGVQTNLNDPRRRRDLRRNGVFLRAITYDGADPNSVMEAISRSE